MVSLKDVFALLIETGMMVSFTRAGYLLGNSPGTKVVFAVLAFVLLAVFWGMTLSPKATYPFRESTSVFVKAILFAIAAGLFYKSGWPAVSVLFALASLVYFTLPRSF